MQTKKQPAYQTLCATRQPSLSLRSKVFGLANDAKSVLSYASRATSAPPKSYFSRHSRSIASSKVPIELQFVAQEARLQHERRQTL